MKAAPIALAASLILVACGGNDSPAEQRADSLEEAAEQSNPAAAEVLEERAEQIRESNIQNPSATQDALEAAGNAQAAGIMTNGNAQ